MDNERTKRWNRSKSEKKLILPLALRLWRLSLDVKLRHKPKRVYVTPPIHPGCAALGGAGLSFVEKPRHVEIPQHTERTSNIMMHGNGCILNLLKCNLCSIVQK